MKKEDWASWVPEGVVEMETRVDVEGLRRER